MSEPVPRPKPLPLPRFTLLCGPRDRGQLRLAAALQSQDESLCAVDLEEPLRLATMDLFFGGFRPDLDLSSPSTLAGALPFASGITMDKWLEALAVEIRVVAGDSVLSRIALSEIDERREIFPFPARYLVRDVHYAADLSYFNTTHPSDCLFICFDMDALLLCAEPSVVLSSSDPLETHLSIIREALSHD